jgi:hypothetical protein
MALQDEHGSFDILRADKISDRTCVQTIRLENDSGFEIDECKWVLLR